MLVVAVKGTCRYEHNQYLQTDFGAIEPERGTTICRVVLMLLGGRVVVVGVEVEFKSSIIELVVLVVGSTVSFFILVF